MISRYRVQFSPQMKTFFSLYSFLLSKKLGSLNHFLMILSPLNSYNYFYLLYQPFWKGTKWPLKSTIKCHFVRDYKRLRTFQHYHSVSTTQVDCILHKKDLPFTVFSNETQKCEISISKWLQFLDQLAKITRWTLKFFIFFLTPKLS